MPSSAAQPQPPEETGLTVAAVARLMGVAPATLRTWDRRYGLGPSEHRPGSHRRYTDGDVARLEYMRRLVIAGYPAADAARSASALSDDEAVAAGAGEVPDVGPDGQQHRHGGGKVIALPGGSDATRGLARAAQSLDAAACEAVIRESLETRGVVWTWDALLVPVLQSIGETWSRSGGSVEVEHVLSGVVRDCFAASIREAPEPLGSRPALLACTPDEEHALPLWALGAALAERRVGTRILGARLPKDALLSSVRRIGPAVVFLWAQTPRTADVDLVASLPSTRPSRTILLGGPAWREFDNQLPAGVSMVTDLSDAVARSVRALGR